MKSDSHMLVHCLQLAVGTGLSGISCLSVEETVGWGALLADRKVLLRLLLFLDARMLLLLDTLHTCSGMVVFLQV